MSSKTAGQLNAEVASFLAGESDLERDGFERGRALRKAAGTPKRSKDNGPLVGYTDSGKPIHIPEGVKAPNTNDIVILRRTQAKFAGWTKKDHEDAEGILGGLGADYGNELTDAERNRAKRWSSVHWDLARCAR